MSAIADHLWQSTWFAFAAWLLALFLRKDFARVRYWIWLAASLKFLVPFALLGWIGNHFVLQLHDRPTLLPMVQEIAAPLSGGTILIERFGDASTYALIAVWALGAAAVLKRWIAEWACSRSLVRTSAPCEVISWVEVRCSDRLREPAVVGLFKPVLLLPKHALETLSPRQIEAVIAHETWHVRRRDNLAALLHTWVQILFWFHPMVWKIGGKLVQEREHACDEGALQDGCDPVTYAETLLCICRHSVASRHSCAAGATGGDLSARIRAIVSAGTPSRLVFLRRTLVAAALLGCIGGQIALGMKVFAASDLNVPAGARLIRLSKPADQTITVLHDDYVYARNVSLRELISDVYSVDGRGISSRERPLDYPRYDIELRAASGTLADQQQLVAELLKQQFNLELIVQQSSRPR